jgi:hypothetical protein
MLQSRETPRNEAIAIKIPSLEQPLQGRRMFEHRERPEKLF